MNHKWSVEDQRYLNMFESYEIDAATFHHREHLRIAYVLVATYGLEAAFVRLKASLLGLLNHLGVGTEKYHETVTYAWLLAVHHFMHMTADSKSFDDFIHRNSLLLDASIMGSHYSQSLLQSPEAKAKFLEPDLDPIPRYDNGRFV